MADPGQPTLGGICRGVKGGCTCSKTPFPAHEPPTEPLPPCTLHPREAGSVWGKPASATPYSKSGNREKGSSSSLRSGLTCGIPGWPQRVLLGSEGEAALLGTVEPDAGLLEAVKVAQGKGLVSRPAEHGAGALHGTPLPVLGAL